MESHNPLQRAGSALASVTATTRSHTDPQRQEKHSLHRRLHANTITSRTRPRHHAKDAVPHSAAELKPPISFDHILRRDRKSPDPSRGASPAHTPKEAQAEAERRRVTPGDVVKAKRENERREVELRQRLQQVEELAMGSTRQLDDTYYAILEKAATLQSTVEGLRRLAEESKRSRAMFDEGRTELERNTATGLDSFQDFEQPEKNIHELVAKLHASRTATEKLNERLEEARHRVEEYERRENETEKTRRKQWRYTSGTLLGVVLLLILVVGLRNRRDVAGKLDGFGAGLARLGDVVVEDVAMPVSELVKPSPSEDPRLKRLFDEL